MLISRKARKPIAAMLLLVFSTSVFTPQIAHALTSGPAAPEAASFEPVDTSDMVNLLSGDLTYNIPLLEVPGPEGGYPLSLSYHAGVQTDADASWVGLGWTLNPGAISRDVNGYPDDYTNVKQTRRDFWNGGVTHTYQFGVSVGLAGSPASVSFGLSIANDTYKGFGVGVDLSIGMPVGPLSLSAGVGINPYGGAYAGFSAGIGFGVPIASNMALGAGGGISITTNFKTVDAGLTGGVGLSYSHSVDGYDKPLTHQLLGASISSNSTKPSLSAGGFTATAGNSKAGNIQTSSSGWGIGIPITPVFGIYLGKRKVRYWSDETLNVYTNGALHMDFAMPTASGSNSGFFESAFDTYHLHDNTNYNMGQYPDAREALGGTFPDNDYYNVSAQGLGGNMRPYAFKEEVYIQNDKFDVTKFVRQWVPPLPNTQNPDHYVNPWEIQYRFVNDFSNRYLQTQQDFTYNSNWIYPAFDNSPTYGNGDGNTSYNPNRQQLAGSKHIEFIDNINMLPGTSHTNNSLEKFYEPTAQGFVRRGMISGGTELDHSFNYQIGGYKITNESGVTYHYMLPAYTGAEYVYTRKKGSGDATFNMIQKNAYYAYAWYLTGVTGPDYVDNNNDGKINEGDWGYWVSFEYGKWCEDYIWRNPSEGYHSDLDTDFETQSAGKKELYYLNKMKTATHTAIFEKQLRYDGKGINSATTNSAYGSYPLYNGGFNASSKSTLGLKRILMMSNADANSLSTTAGSLSGHYFNNVFDATDINTTAAQKAIRIIMFNYDYSLCPSTPNSYDYANINDKKGKLTLLSLGFGGKAGVCAIPPISFNYELEAPELKTATVTSSGTTSLTGTNVFQQGDILRLTSGGNTYYCTILRFNGVSTYTIRYLTASTPGSGTSLTATTTKNPPYGKDNHDIWNMYKSDYDPAKASYGENTAYATTPVSAKAKDVWSLRSFTSSLGNKVKMEYESDFYRTAVLEQGYKIQMSAYPNPSFFFYDNYNNRFYYTINNIDQMDLDNLSLGDRFDAVLFWHRYASSGGGPGCHVSDFCVIDTKGKPDCYLEVTDLSMLGSNIIGFRFYNVHERTVPTNPTCEFMNSFPSTSAGCYVMPYIGNIKGTSKKINIPGGNLRVKSIATVNTTTNQIQRTVYDYMLPDQPTINSGITSFEPSVFDDASFTGFFSTDAEKKAYKKVLYKYNSQMISYTRELPPPGVMYEYVSIRNQVYNPEDNITRTVEGKTTYQFEVFNERMVGVKEVAKTGPTPYPGDPDPTYNTLETRKLQLKNFTTAVGNMKRVIRYDNNGKKLSETINHYLSDDADKSSFLSFANSYEQSLSTGFSNQGVLKENFVNIRYITNGGSYLGARKAVNSLREEYPTILLDQTKVDYVTNTKTSTQNLAFDFYSGAVTKKLFVDANGNRFMSKMIPAYIKYPSMGLRITNWANKNMLTQQAESYTYKVDGSNNPTGLVSASVQTWSNAVEVMKPDNNTIYQNDAAYGTTTGNIWRPRMTYAWMPEGSTTDGITSIGLFVDFDWNNQHTPASQNAGWRKTGEVTLYTTNTNVLEASDINGNYGSAKMGYGLTRVLMSGSPARYAELAYTGVEDDIANGTYGGFSLGGGTINTNSGNAHTGVKSVLLGTSVTGLSYSVPINKLQQGKDYFASVWVKGANNATFNPAQAGLYYKKDEVILGYGTHVSTVAAVGNWCLMNLKIPASALTSGTTLTIGCYNNNTSSTAYFDDVRFHPLNASVSSFVYSKTGELTHVLDNNNFYTQYEYDAVGRLVKTYRETVSGGLRPVTEYTYNYGVTIPQFSSAPINQSYQKNDCPPGYFGSLVSVNVPAGQFTSCVSQPDADAQAQAYAQDYANTNGTCSCSTSFTFTPGITQIYQTMSVSGTSVYFTWVFYWPTGQTLVNVGTINSNCAWPTTTRTIPRTVGNATYNVIISPSGNVSVQWLSGPLPTGGIGFSGTYDRLANSYYSVAKSGSFQKNNCPAGQTGSWVTYNVPAYSYSSLVSQAAADQLAQDDVNNNGQNYANSNGTCTVNCTFSPSMSMYTSSVGSNGSGTGNFNFVFSSPSSSWWGGSLGTINAGPCRPSSTRVVYVTDGATPSRTWQVTITSGGAVSVSVSSGPAAGFGPPVVIGGTYPL